EDGIRDFHVTGVQTYALPISGGSGGGGNALTGWGNAPITLTGPDGQTITINPEDMPPVGQELRLPDGTRVQLGNDAGNGEARIKIGTAACRERVWAVDVAWSW